MVLAISKQKASLAALIENIAKANEDLKTYQKDFEDKLKEKFENLEAYMAYLSREGELKAQKDLVETYFTDLAREKTTKENFSFFKDKAPEDLFKFEDDLKEVTREIKVLDDDKIKLSTILNSIKKDGVKIKKSMPPI